jgi:hypothetical protein
LYNNVFERDDFMFNRTETINFRSFIRDEYKKDVPVKLIALGAATYALAIPKYALAAGETDKVFGDIYPVVMDIIDWIVVGVFIMCGLKWMQGNRSNALELLLGGCIGYLICRHAIDIREFLKGIGE